MCVHVACKSVCTSVSDRATVRPCDRATENVLAMSMCVRARARACVCVCVHKRFHRTHIRHPVSQQRPLLTNRVCMVLHDTRDGCTPQNNNIFYYLKIDSRYIGCIQGNCLQLTNWVKQVTPVRVVAMYDGHKALIKDGGARTQYRKKMGPTLFRHSSRGF